MLLSLSEPQLIIAGVIVTVIAFALIAISVLGTSEVRCCRVCHRLDVVSHGLTPGWVEPTLCSECASFRAALLERRQFRYRLPREAGNDGNR